jgi:TIR domain-containing protein
LRQVNKVIFLLKAFSGDGTPLLLNTLSADWKMSLFINSSLPEGTGGDAILLKRNLSGRLNVSVDDIHLSFNPTDGSMKSSVEKETADKEKRAKYGSKALYNFIYCPVSIKNVPEHILQKTFEINHVGFQWVALNSLKSDENVKKHNSDILEFVSAKFDQTLVSLPLSFTNKIQYNSPRVFISYAKEDYERVSIFSGYLRKKGLNVFIDTDFLKIGDDWSQTILDRIESSDFFIICLSETAVNKKGFIQKELRYAYGLQDLMSGESAFILPLRLTECKPPRNLAKYQYIDWFSNNDIKTLDKILGHINEHYTARNKN